MIKFVLAFVFACCSAQNNPLIGYDFGQHYSRIRIFEYDGYSDVKFLKFNIQGPTLAANWSLTLSVEGKCPDDFAYIHFYLQHGTYPLIAPRNESFPQGYITTRHHFFKLVFNQTVTNPLIQLHSPSVGTWFAMAFVYRQTSHIQSKVLNSGCNFYLSTWLDYQVVPISLTLRLNDPIQLTLTNNKSSLYTSYYTVVGPSRIVILSEWTTNCEVTILAKLNSLPTMTLFDYRTTCKNKVCSIDIDQLSAFVWIYFQIFVTDSSCLKAPIYGHMTVRSMDCSTISNSFCVQSYPTRRIMFNYYYDFLYVPIYTGKRSAMSGSTSSIMLNGRDSSMFSYEFVVDDRNIGGTLHFDFETRMTPTPSMNLNVSILACISKYRARSYDTCENDFKMIIDKNSILIKSIPYPEMAYWYLTLQYACHGSLMECRNTSMTLMFQISSSQCTKQQCGTYGVCRILTSQQNVFSTCSCIAGYRGYGCTDSTHAYASKSLISVLFLTISNLMFLPAIVLAIYRRLYIEALIYFFNMFFSTFYHACDQDINKLCIFKYDGLQLSDFIGSYASFIITLITMAILPRSTKVFLFMLGVLACIVTISRDRFDHLQFIFLIAVTFSFTVLTWMFVSVKYRRLQPNLKRLLLYMPGFLLALAGLILFALCETDENYWYTHSLWHIFIASSILFFLPRNNFYKQDEKALIKENESPTSIPLLKKKTSGSLQRRSPIEPDTTTNSDSPSIEIES